jgi:hypothetical protein
MTETYRHDLRIRGRRRLEFLGDKYIAVTA